jgi:hypothetical protein
MIVPGAESIQSVVCGIVTIGSGYLRSVHGIGANLFPPMAADMPFWLAAALLLLISFGGTIFDGLYWFCPVSRVSQPGATR